MREKESEKQINATRKQITHIDTKKPPLTIILYYNDVTFIYLYKYKLFALPDRHCIE